MAKNEGRNPRTGKFLPGNSCAQKSGIHHYLATGQLPSVRGKKALKKHLQEIQEELETITSKMNIKKKILISHIIRTEGVLKLIEMYVKRHGILRPDKYKKGLLELHPTIAGSYLSFLNTQKASVMALGLDEKQAEKILTPYELIQREEEKANKENVQ